MEILIVILGLIVAALTWCCIFFLMDVIEYIIQELIAEFRKVKQNIKHSMWDLEWKLKLMKGR